MRTAITFALLIGAAFAAYASVPAAIAMFLVALGIGAKVTVRDEEGFTAFLSVMAGAGLLALIVQQLYYHFFT